MIKKLTCIQCPRGCQLIAEIENGYVLKVSNNQCPKGDKYARVEIESPTRTLTSSVLTKNLDLKMVPVKTDQPIPKNKQIAGMEKIKTILLDKPVSPGDIIVEDFLGLKVNLIATRAATVHN